MVSGVFKNFVRDDVTVTAFVSEREGSVNEITVKSC